MPGRTILVILTSLILCTSFLAAEDDNLPDTLIIKDAELINGGQGVVTFEFVNDEELAALTIPIRVVGKGIKIDSVSFIDSRVAYLNMLPVTISEDSESVIFGAICMVEEYIQPGRGLMARMYLSASAMPDRGSDPIRLDTTTIGPATVLFTKTNSASFVPRVNMGQIHMVTASGEAPGTKED